MNFIRLAIITTMDRNQAISIVSQNISGCGGWITNHALFSNMAATINFEIPKIKIKELITKLQDNDLIITLDGDPPESKSNETRGSVTLTFLHNEADLIREVPEFG